MARGARETGALCSGGLPTKHALGDLPGPDAQRQGGVIGAVALRQPAYLARSMVQPAWNMERMPLWSFAGAMAKGAQQLLRLEELVPQSYAGGARRHRRRDQAADEVHPGVGQLALVRGVVDVHLVELRLGLVDGKVLMCVWGGGADTRRKQLPKTLRMEFVESETRFQKFRVGSPPTCP